MCSRGAVSAEEMLETPGTGVELDWLSESAPSLSWKELLMRLSLLIGFTLLAATTAAKAAELPTGVWLVEDKNGQIRIENCNGALWGILVWEKEPSQDTENPDPKLRGRPTLGIPILLDLKETTIRPMFGPPEQRWAGHAYNATNGKTYEINVKLLKPDVLRIEGCLVGGFLCGGQEWTRVVAPQQPKGTAPKTPAPKGAPKGPIQ